MHEHVHPTISTLMQKAYIYLHDGRRPGAVGDELFTEMVVAGGQTTTDQGREALGYLYGNSHCARVCW